MTHQKLDVRRPSGRPRDTKPSPGAVRQRRYIKRRTAGWKVVPVPLTEREAAILVRHGWAELGADARALGRALRQVLAWLGDPEDWPRRYGAGT